MILKVTVLFGVALVATLLMRRASAATRHALLAAAQIAALALPLLPSIVPVVPVDDSMFVYDGVPSAGFQPAAGTTPPVRFPRVETIWLAGFLIVIATKATRLMRAIGVVRRAHNNISDEIDQPMTLGTRILLPRSAESWSEERLRAVLLHERAHVARHDTLVALAGDLACAVFWFHPLAWVVERRARYERERACDDAVLADGIAADDYAMALVDVARHIRCVALGLPIATRSHLESRVRAILDPCVPRRASHAKLAAVVMLAVAPALAALEAIPRPRSGEPDLLGDAVARPQSELLAILDEVPRVQASGPDAEFIAFLQKAASRPPRQDIDYVPQRARWALTQVRDGELIAPLIEALEHRDWRVRAYAAWALGWSGDRRATGPLIEMLDEPVWRERAMAVHALANLADPAAENAMMRVVDDPAWQVRSGVVQYLAARGVHRATLRALSTDRHMYVRMLAEDALQ